MKKVKPTIQGLMNARTVERRRHLARFLARRRRLGSRHLFALGVGELGVDLLVEVGQAGLQVIHPPGLPLVDEAVEQLLGALPAAVIGVVVVFWFPKIFRNVSNFVSGLRSGDFADDSVVGTLRSPLESSTWASSSVARYLVSAQPCSGCAARLGMPMMLPVV